MAGKGKPTQQGLTPEEVRRFLERGKKKIFSEIAGYPSPITGCDQHFNLLLEQRDQITAELRQLTDVLSGDLSRPEPAESLADFVRSSRFLERESG